MTGDLLESWLAKLAPDLALPRSEREPRPINQADSLLLCIAKPAMACEFEVLVNQHQYAGAADAALAALVLVEQLEALLSVYQARSELSLLNRFGGTRAMPLSIDSMTLLQLAQAVHGWTNGAFDITASSLSDCWGFSRRQGRKPSEEELQAALLKVGSHYLELHVESATARFQKDGVSVNPGGIGKGYTLDRAAGKLIQAGVGDFMMHGGLSSVLARGHRNSRDSGGGWLVSLKHPWRWEEHLGTLRLRDQALGTSGSGKQFFHFGGQRYSHIIDPRSGWPAQAMLSTTVVCASGAVADALATAFFVMGLEATRAFCAQHPQISAVLIYIDPVTGKQKLETCNTTDDMWQPARGVM